MKKLRIGTRPSQLALAQTEMVINSLKAKLPELEFETVIIKTSGDSKQSEANNIIRDKRDWIEELEQAILREAIDLAVHSGKDVPYDISEKTILHSVLDRADPRDIFIGRLKIDGNKILNQNRLIFTELPQGARVGTCSLRRRAQLLILRPDLKIEDLRGNVPTRLRKLDSDSSYDGIVLASAGLIRLGNSLEGMDVIPPELMLPASAQGILTVQFKKDREDLTEWIKKISLKNTEACLFAERSAIRCLEADCASAVAIHAKTHGDNLEVKGRVFSYDGEEFIEALSMGPISKSEELGRELGLALLKKGAKKLLS